MKTKNLTWFYLSLQLWSKFSPFFFFFIFLKFYFIFKVYNIVLVLPNIEMNLPQVYVCSPSWTLLPPPFPYHPSGSSQCTSPKHPALCIEPGLATRFIYDIIRISIPFSQIIPPSPSPTESFKVKLRGEGRVREFGKVIHTLLYSKWITNKDLL